MRELDPFYTWGISYQKGLWSFSASSTFNQNFRRQFHSQAIIPQNNYSFICDFEIDRPLISRLPGLVSVFRAEPVYNFHSKSTPGLAGMDFRFYYGVRLQAAKPPLNQTIQQLRQRYSTPGQADKTSMSKEKIRRALAQENTSTMDEKKVDQVRYSYVTPHGRLPDTLLWNGSSQRKDDRCSFQNVVDQDFIRLAL